MPAVSVIMPAYNVEAYIGEAIASVLAQTFNDFELIIVDDGATDRTGQIAREYAKRDRRIVVIHQQNAGLPAARNAAMRRARAGIFALLDSDDLWAPEFLDEQLAILRSRPDVDIVTGNALTLGSHLDGRPARPWPDHRPQPDLTSILDDEYAIFIMCVFTRRVYETIGGFDEMLRTNEDFDYWLRAALAGLRFVRNDRPLGYYRRRDDSLSASQVRMLRGALRVCYKHRPALFTRPELPVLDEAIQRYEAELLAAEARTALTEKHFNLASRHLTELRERRGGAALGLARILARWMPGLLWRAYEMRRRRQTATHGVPS
jgi:glycosyltransferase involved in cell wall biosynthesis